MKVAAVGALLYGIIILIGGVIAFFQEQSVAFLVFGIVVGNIYFLLACGCFKEVVPAGYVSGALTFFLAVYWAYRFIASERFFPGGVLLILSFLVLFLILLGVFLGLQSRPQMDAGGSKN